MRLMIEDAIKGMLLRKGSAEISSSIVSESWVRAYSDNNNLHCKLWHAAGRYEFRKEPFEAPEGDDDTFDRIIA